MNTPITRIDVFAHSGSSIPTELQSLINKDLTQKQIDDTIEVNRDTGLEFVLEHFHNNPRPDQLIFTYDYARVLTDANRIEFRHQMPDQPYRGEKLVNYTDELKAQINAKYIRPWQEELMAAVRKYPTAQIIHWHTMDTHSVGKSTIGSKHEEGVLRPMGQIVTRIDVGCDSLKPYFADFSDAVMESQLIDVNKVQPILDVFTKKLKQFSKFSDQSEYLADNPYKLFGQQGEQRILGPLLTCLLSILTDNACDQQLVFEMRKDIITGFESAAEAIRAIDEVVEIMRGN